MKRALDLLHHVDLSRKFSNHLIGENHTHYHRKIMDASIMIMGVILAKSAHFIPMFSVEILADVIGYSFHGIGLIPFIKTLEKEQNPTE